MPPLKLLGLSYVLVAATNLLVLKEAVQTASPMAFGALSNGVAFVALAFLAQGGGLERPRGRDWSLLALTGLVQTAAVSALVLIGLQTAGIGRAALLLYASPLWATLLAFWWLGERPTGAGWIGLVLGLTGLAAIFQPGFPADAAQSAGAAVPGEALILAASLLQAVVIVLIRGGRWRLRPLSVATWQSLVGGLGLALLGICIEGPAMLVGAPPPLWAILVNGLLGTAYVIWAGYRLNRDLPANSFSMMTMAIPCLALALGFAVGTDTPNLWTIAGLFLIATGTVLALRAPPHRLLSSSE